MANTGTALAVAFTAAIAVLSIVLLAVLIVRCWRGRRDGCAASGSSSRAGFVLFDVCFHDDRRQRNQAARPSSMSVGRSRRQEPREHSPPGGEQDQEPDESELARWKNMFRGTTRSLSTIDEGTEKGTTPITTPAFCTPPASPDRRDARARALDMASVAVQVKP